MIVWRQSCMLALRLNEKKQYLQIHIAPTEGVLQKRDSWDLSLRWWSGDEQTDEAKLFTFRARPFSGNPLAVADWWFGFGFEPLVLVEGE